MPITRDGALAYLRTNLVDVTRYDYQDQIFRTGYGTDNNISVSGGTDKTNDFTSASYLKNEGIIGGTDFTRYNFRVRIDQRLHRGRNSRDFLILIPSQMKRPMATYFTALLIPLTSPITFMISHSVTLPETCWPLSRPVSILCPQWRIWNSRKS